MGCCVSRGIVKVNPSCSDNNNRHSGSHGEIAKTSEDCQQDDIVRSSGEKVSLNKEMNNHVRGTQISCTNNVDEGEGNTQTNHLKQDTGLSQPDNSYTGNNTTQKCVSFVIPFEEDRSRATPLLYPRRLKKLQGAPCLTAEMLKEKQELAEKNRRKELWKKVETTSKCRRDIFKARETTKLENAQLQIHTKLMATETNRQNHIKGIISKQKQLEQRARKVLENACLNNNEQIVHIDETYNSDSSCEGINWDDEDLQKPVESQSKDDNNSIDKFYENVPHSMACNIFR